VPLICGHRRCRGPVDAAGLSPWKRAITAPGDGMAMAIVASGTPFARDLRRGHDRPVLLCPCSGGSATLSSHHHSGGEPRVDSRREDIARTRSIARRERRRRDASRLMAGDFISAGRHVLRLGAQALCCGWQHRRIA